jgi:hypothetical protein
MFDKMKEIKLSQGKVALVDDEDYDYLNQWKWYANRDGYNYYAVRVAITNGCRQRIWMHRVIMKTPDDMVCDHIYHNGLDNRKFIEINGVTKCNLRNCTQASNCKNRTSHGRSKYLGVSSSDSEKRNKKYLANISIKGKRVYLGRYYTEELAALTYDEAAKKHHVEFANLNFK